MTLFNCQRTSVTFATDAAGQASMTYYGMQPPSGIDTDTIQASFTDNQGQQLCNTAIKHWVDNFQPLVLQLTPEEATNELGTPGQTHTVTAAVRAEYGNVIVDRLVTFSILTGPNFGQSFSANTDASGLASFTYEAIPGIPGMGTDTIQACITSITRVKPCAIPP